MSILAKITNPQPILLWRFIISAAFLTCALGLAPFVLVGVLIRGVGSPLVSISERFTKPKSKPRRTPVALAHAKAVEEQKAAQAARRYSPSLVSSKSSSSEDGSPVKNFVPIPVPNGAISRAESEAQAIAAAARVRRK